MPDYFSPGVYIEEFESGPRPMSGVSTSIPGFLGLTAKGPIVGLPQLITSAAEFKRIYGSYLSKYEYGNFRFLPYAIDLFFANGGSACYVMRVEVPEASFAECIINPKTPIVVNLVAQKEDKGNLNNTTEEVPMLTYETIEGISEEDIVKIKVSSMEKEYNLKSQNKFSVNEKEENLMGHIFLITKYKNEDAICDRTNEFIQAYCIINSVEVTGGMYNEILSVYSKTKFYTDECFYDIEAADYALYEFVEINIQVYVNNNQLDFYFAHQESVDGKNKYIDDLEKGNIFYVQNKDKNIKLKLNFNDKLIKELKNIEKNPIKIIFGDAAQEDKMYEIPSKYGKLPKLDEPSTNIPSNGNIYYKSEEGTNKNVYIYKVDSTIQGLAINPDKTDNKRICLTCTGNKDLITGLKGSILKFKGSGNTLWYCIVHEVTNEDGFYYAKLLNTKYNYELLRLCHVEEYPIEASFDNPNPEESSKKKKLDFFDIDRNSTYEIKLYKNL